MKRLVEPLGDWGGGHAGLGRKGVPWPIEARRRLSARMRLRKWARRYWPELLGQIAPRRRHSDS